MNTKVMWGFHSQKHFSKNIVFEAGQVSPRLSTGGGAPEEAKSIENIYKSSIQISFQFIFLRK